MRFLSLVALSLTILGYTSCAGYRINGSKPEPLRHVSSIHIPLATNLTQIPRAGAYVTNGVVDALVQDGTYRLVRGDQADATLEVEFFTVDYEAIRTARTNRVRPEELALTVQLRWQVRDGENPTRILDSGTSSGRTSLFVDPNLQAAQQSALNDAIERASVSLIARLANGF